MNTSTKNLLLLLLLFSTFILPACGNNEVKSQKVPETVLKSSTQTIAPPMVLITPTATVVSTPTVVISAASTSTHVYTKHVKLVKHHALSHTVPMMAATTPLVSTSVPAPTPANFTTDNEMTEKKPSSHWPLIVAGIALVGALGIYFWTKKAPPHNDFPLPPMGGLSPVGGFTAMRNKVRHENKKQSIWVKKIF